MIWARQCHYGGVSRQASTRGRAIGDVMALEIVSRSRCFDGTQFTYQHRSLETGTRLGDNDAPMTANLASKIVLSHPWAAPVVMLAPAVVTKPPRGAPG